MDFFPSQPHQGSTGKLSAEPLQSRVSSQRAPRCGGDAWFEMMTEGPMACFGVKIFSTPFLFLFPIPADTRRVAWQQRSSYTKQGVPSRGDETASVIPSHPTPLCICFLERAFFFAVSFSDSIEWESLCRSVAFA